jgi:hypothetical protein
MHSSILHELHLELTTLSIALGTENEAVSSKTKTFPFIFLSSHCIPTDELLLLDLTTHGEKSAWQEEGLVCIRMHIEQQKKNSMYVVGKKRHIK